MILFEPVPRESKIELSNPYAGVDYLLEKENVREFWGIDCLSRTSSKIKFDNCWLYKKRETKKKK